MKRTNWYLAAMVLLGFFLRTWRLGSNPPGLYWDEVSLGWNAYSILKTGYDEHGRFLPIDTFFAFGDYKPPGYIYAAVPAIAIFGLNEFAVRLPSSLAGTLLILVTFFLVREILRSDLAATRSDLYQRMPLLAALLLAISPWSVTLSRVAFESNLALLFNAAGGLFFLLAVNRSPRWLLISVVSFILSAYTFNANRLLAPLMLVGLTAIYWRTAARQWKWWVIGTALSILLIVPMLGHLRSPEGRLRWQEVNIFSNLSVIEESNQRRELDRYVWYSRLLHHRYLGFARLFLQHYTDQFDLNYLFLRGDPNPRISIPDFGELYLVELPFFIIGLMSLMRPMGLITSGGRILLILWLLLAAIPAGLARETPHALRSASNLPVPQIIVALGISSIIQYIALRPAGRRAIYFLLPLFLFLFLSLVHFQLIYWRYYRREWAGEWLTSYKPLVQYIVEVGDNYENVYITPDLGRPYVYFLFYMKYDPTGFIQAANNRGRTGDAFGFFRVNSFDKYRFYIPPWEQISPHDLVVMRPDSPPPGFSLLRSITDINGQSQFNVISR